MRSKIRLRIGLASGFGKKYSSDVHWFFGRNRETESGSRRGGVRMFNNYNVNPIIAIGFAVVVFAIMMVLALNAP
jgi:hypothetical protein